MNFTFPIADLGCSARRISTAVIGHLLNGYDTRFLKRNLRGKPR